MATNPEVEAYYEALPDERKEPMLELRKVLGENLPPGFEESMTGGMPGFVVPLETYPAGYHTTPGQPLPLIALASQKRTISVHHLGVYADPELLEWFTKAYADLGIGRLDMGKGCIRFGNMKKIPYELLGELATKVTPEEWVAEYEGLRAGR
jgi:hypothetical protein